VHSHTVCVPETIDRREVPKMCKDRAVSLRKQIRDCRIVVVSGTGMASYGLHSFQRMGGKGLNIQ
jgi:hypothetical protein